MGCYYSTQAKVWMDDGDDDEMHEADHDEIDDEGAENVGDDADDVNDGESFWHAPVSVYPGYRDKIQEILLASEAACDNADQIHGVNC